ncbi:bifunctional glycoside hydrolase 114/ polysaccharide deacetylase family protein [Halopseudomonas nanhaiensis]|uniref:bifunctional glycoside hydrolase 114/ polysaccharide deacetylase family protein n=1 Tax=Halopseudomonas nanhaiensis TaxID=2830842 RepID=UPI001CBD2281|nr:bifunctional glycoside hydrolase 114/ polysaccharide deacetylase family protein [Halopseudomonas nanhaiensis]
MVAGILLLCVVSAGQATTLPSVAFWYADQPPLAELSQFDWVVVEPAHLSADNVAFLCAQGSLPFAYLSIGELDASEAEQYPDVARTASTSVTNHGWNSQVMDLTSPVWRAHLLSQARSFSALGYRGLFLDTLDSFTLLPKAEHSAQREALVTLIAALNQAEPELKLFFNRGFEVLPELGESVAAVAAESLRAGWDASANAYRNVPEQDRQWLEGQLAPLRDRGVPVIAIEYLPPERRDEARKLAAALGEQGYVPYITTPQLDSLGVGSIEVHPRRIAVLYDPREGSVSRNDGHTLLGGVIEHLGYRVDYLSVDGSSLPVQPLGLYAGVVVWMTSGAPDDPYPLHAWLSARLDEGLPMAFMAGLPVDDTALLRRLGLRRSSEPVRPGLTITSQDETLLGAFEAPVVARTRGMVGLSLLPGGPTASLTLTGADGRTFSPVAIGEWGGLALSPYVLEDGAEQRRWILDPFAFLQRALRLPPMPRPDATTENGLRIATVHIDGDGFVSRAEAAGAPYAGQVALDQFIEPYPLLTSASVVEGEVGPKGMYPYLAPKLEPIARKIFAHPRVEVATHSYSHPFYWQPERAAQREGFHAEYGLNMAIPGYTQMDLEREIVGSRDYINERLTTPDKPVKMIFWSGDAVPDDQTIRLAYEAGLSNVNGGATILTHANPSLTGLYPLLRPTAGGLQVYAPIINENVYTNLWRGPFYGFKGVMETFELTDTPRRLRGMHLYYHFYSATKQASIKVMRDIYRSMLAEQPFSMWMSDYVQRVHGLHSASLAQRGDGAWQVKGLGALRTLRLDPAMGWPDLLRSDGVAGVRELPQGRYVHLSKADATIALRTERDTRPALEHANLPLQRWEYDTADQVTFSFAGQFPLRFAVRAAGQCTVRHSGKTYSGASAAGVWMFEMPMEQVTNAQLTCR